MATGIFLLAALLPALNAASFYTSRPIDPKAVYLASPQFPVNADGKGDDSPALQQAIDRVQERQTHGIVFVPSGTYRLGSVVNLWRGVRLIGFGEKRPVFLLGENTPGYQDGSGKYMIHFRDSRPKPGQPMPDARNTTFYSGVNNIDFEIRDGNRAAVAVRFHVAQLSSLEHIEFRIGSGRGAVEETGNEIEDCRFIGGEFGISTGPTSPGWQALVADSVFEGQRRAAIETKDAGMTVIRSQFRKVPVGILVPAHEKLFVKDSRFEDVAETGIVIANYFDPRTQVNLRNVEFARVPLALRVLEVGVPPSVVPVEAREVRGSGEFYRINRYVQGLHHETGASKEPVRRLAVQIERDALSGLGELAPKDYSRLPSQSSWANVAAFGAKGDGTTDDTAAFRAAIAKHQAVYIPQGKYRVTDTIRLRPDTVLIGLHPWTTQFVLAPKTPGFTDPGSPKAVIEAPRGGKNIFTGIGVDSDRNEGAIAIRWAAGDGSLIDDVLMPWGLSRAGKGKEQLYGLWVTDGGGGTVKNLWLPNSHARNGLYVSDTSTRGRVYLVSVEHHVEVEVLLERVSNWEIYALQTEENLGSEKATAMRISDCRDLMFANLFMYRIRACATPFADGIQIARSKGIRIGGVHNFSGGPFPFDFTASLLDRNQRVVDREIAWLSVE